MKKLGKYQVPTHPLVKQVIEPGIAAGKTGKQIQYDLHEYVYDGPWKDSVVPAHKDTLIPSVNAINRFKKDVNEVSKKLEGDLVVANKALKSADPVIRAAGVAFGQRRMDMETTFFYYMDRSMDFVREISNKITRGNKDYNAFTQMSKEVRSWIIDYGKMTGQLAGDGTKLSSGERRATEIAINALIRSLREEVFAKLAPEVYHDFIELFIEVLKKNEHTANLVIENGKENES